MKKQTERIMPVKHLQNALDYHMDALKRTQQFVSELREELKGRCDHAMVEEYIWEQDNGYGSQHKVLGKRCVYCLFVDLWNRGHFADPATLRD